MISKQQEEKIIAEAAPFLRLIGLDPERNREEILRLVRVGPDGSWSYNPYANADL